MSDPGSLPRGTTPPLAGRVADTVADWLTVVDAAAQIGCSKRTVERLARAGKLEQRLRPQAGSPAVAVYNPEDVARIALERRPAASPFVLPHVPAGNGNGHTVSTQLQANAARIAAQAELERDDPIRQLFAAALRAVLSPPSPPVSPLLAAMAESLSPDERAAQYVTVPEASAIKGLTETRLRRLIKAGTLPAIKDGAWKIRRKDLEQL